jgi:RsiW-degrading membrane proteinase PrsW (M82 family)
MRAFPSGAMKGPDRPTKSLIFPILTNWRDVQKKGYLGPITVTIILGFLIAGIGPSSPTNAILALGLYIAVATCFLSYRICGKPISWLAYILFLGITAVWFAVSLPVILQTENAFKAAGVPNLGAGVVEELWKFMPVLAMWLLGRAVDRKGRGNWPYLGVREPLDGILLGVGSGAVFGYLEAILFVRQEGLLTVISRTFILLAVHSSCAGLLGYFFGLSVLIPRSRVKLVGIGYALAAGIHTLDDVLASNKLGPVQIGLGVLTYGLLAAAILKARKISPTRYVNFASRVFQHPAVVGAEAEATPKPAVQPASAGVSALSPALQAAVVELQLPDRRIALANGLHLMVTEVPGLVAGEPDGVVACVERRDPQSDVLGLCNLSTRTWSATTRKGNREIPPGHVIKVQPGTEIDFGDVTGRFVT